MSVLTIHFDDPEQGRQVAAELRDLFGVEATLRVPTPAEATVKGDGLQVLQLILTLPIATVATHTLLERMQAGDKLKALRARAQEHGWLGMLYVPGQAAVPLAEMDPGKLLDAAVEPPQEM